MSSGSAYCFPLPSASQLEAGAKCDQPAVRQTYACCCTFWPVPLPDAGAWILACSLRSPVPIATPTPKAVAPTEIRCSAAPTALRLMTRPRSAVLASIHRLVAAGGVGV